MRNVPFFLFAIICIANVYIADSFHLVVSKASNIRNWNKQVQVTNPLRKKMSMSLTGLNEDTIFPAVAHKTMNNLTKRTLTGSILGALGTSWIASNSKCFGAGFLAVSYIMHDEFTAMTKHTQSNAIIKMGMVASLLCHAFAVLYHPLHELVVPGYFGILMASLVLSNREPTNINQIATSLLGVIYTGYLPSFWVRLHGLASPYISMNSWISAEAATIWWSWAAIASSDVGAYFVGNKFGRHKLSTISTAAGHASPNKSVEGALAGVLSSSLVASLGAKFLQWPLWPVTGALYGLMLGSLGLVGDLTASAMKRDAGVKDTGSLLPGHGGLLDRFDSYILSAPLAYYFVRDLLPWVGRVVEKYH